MPTPEIIICGTVIGFGLGFLLGGANQDNTKDMCKSCETPSSQTKSNSNSEMKSNSSLTSTRQVHPTPVPTSTHASTFHSIHASTFAPTPTPVPVSTFAPTPTPVPVSTSTPILNFSSILQAERAKLMFKQQQTSTTHDFYNKIIEQVLECTTKGKAVCEIPKYLTNRFKECVDLESTNCYNTPDLKSMLIKHNLTISSGGVVDGDKMQVTIGNSDED